MSGELTDYGREAMLATAAPLGALGALDQAINHFHTLVSRTEDRLEPVLRGEGPVPTGPDTIAATPGRSTLAEMVERLEWAGARLERILDRVDL